MHTYVERLRQQVLETALDMRSRGELSGREFLLVLADVSRCSLTAPAGLLPMHSQELTDELGEAYRKITEAM